MAMMADVRYIRLYTDGSSARKIAPVAPVKKRSHAVAQPQKQKRVTLRLDPVAVLGIVVSLVMLVCILVGMSSLEAAQAEVTRLEDKVVELRVQNAELEANYKDSYNLESIREAALELGMVPYSQVDHVSLEVETEHTENKTVSIEKLFTTLADLFA